MERGGEKKHVGGQGYFRVVRGGELIVFIKEIGDHPF